MVHVVEVLLLEAVHTVEVDSVGNLRVDGEVGGLDLVVDEVRVQAEGDVLAVALGRTLVRGSTDQDVVGTSNKVAAVHKQVVVARLVRAEVGKCGGKSAVSVAVVAGVLVDARVGVAADPGLNVAVLDVGNLDHKAVVGLEPLLAHLQGVHLVHTGLERVPEDLTNFQLLGVVAHIGVDVVRTLGLHGDVVVGVLVVAEVVEVHAARAAVVTVS
mmetsp:Transcript_10367/g.42154  ORF Transcript_10367/g.42154 Transcript_10367/m.42154 type:complete len:214 (+) Transcript_10367:1489-2130(+)